MERSTWVSAAKIQDGVLALGEIHDQIGVADVSAHEPDSASGFQVPQILPVTRVGQLVQDSDRTLGPATEGVAHVIRSDEACPAGDQQLHGAPARMGTPARRPRPTGASRIGCLFTTAECSTPLRQTTRDVAHDLNPPAALSPQNSVQHSRRSVRGSLGQRGNGGRVDARV